MATRDYSGEDDSNFKYLMGDNLFVSKESVTEYSSLYLFNLGFVGTIILGYKLACFSLSWFQTLEPFRQGYIHFLWYLGRPFIIISENMHKINIP